MLNNQQEPAFEKLLSYLKQTRGFDFTGYKRPSLTRLTKKRMQQVGVESFSDYLDYLEVNAFEVNQLFDALLLNVTTFFRDLPAWNSLSQKVIPRILEAKSVNEPIRVWSAGCASGEEAYTIAIILAEALGSEEFRTRVKIYATDMDEDALSQARLASYTLKQLRDVPDELRDKYFDVSRNQYNFRNDLRRCMIFGRNNLIQDAPISHLDLLICRNTLMYFNAETQARVLARFHFALNNNGFLFVGKAEMLLAHTNLFTPVNLKHRIFAKMPKTGLRDHLLVLAEARKTEADIHLVKSMRLRDEAFECLSIAQITVDVQGNLALVNRQARVLLGLTLQDQGRPLRDLKLSFQSAEVRSRIQQAYAERQPIQINNVELSCPVKNTVVYLDIEVIPLLDTNSEPLGVTVIFKDVTRYQQLQQDLLRSTAGQETAYKEFQSTPEELETTNSDA